MKEINPTSIKKIEAYYRSDKIDVAFIEFDNDKPTFVGVVKGPELKMYRFNQIKFKVYGRED